MYGSRTKFRGIRTASFGCHLHASEFVSGTKAVIVLGVFEIERDCYFCKGYTKLCCNQLAELLGVQFPNTCYLRLNIEAHCFSRGIVVFNKSFRN